MNLFLHVVGRRQDGLRALDSLVVFPECGDELTATPARDLRLDLDSDGEFGSELLAERGNLALRAGLALAECYGAGRGARITLKKSLPVAAGLGGGSADAAAALRLLRRVWGLSVSDVQLAKLGWRIGADVPVCLASRSARVRGAGEIVIPTPNLPPFWVVLVSSGTPLATAAVFAELGDEAGAEAPISPTRIPDAWALADWLRETRNDLAPAAARLAPGCDRARDALLRAGALYAGMSGSGAAHYGVFPSEAAARSAVARIRGAEPRWWSAAARVRAGADWRG